MPSTSTSRTSRSRSTTSTPSRAPRARRAHPAGPPPARRGPPPVGPPPAATATPARGLGLERTHGTLAPGARADLVVIDGDGFRQAPYRPGHDPLVRALAGGAGGGEREG